MLGRQKGTASPALFGGGQKIIIRFIPKRLFGGCHLFSPFNAA